MSVSMSQPLRILYMEDDAGAARLLQKKLQRLGYTVDLAEDGETGLAMYDATHHDVVAVDHMMPVFDGLQVLRLLSERNPAPPTIMITGAGDERLAVEAIKLGAGDYVVKDAEGGYLELVPAVIQQVLDRRELIRQREEALAALEVQNQHLALLNDMGQALSATLNIQQILWQMLNAANQITASQASSIWLRSQEVQPHNGLVCQAVLCQGDYIANAGRALPDGQGLVGQVAWGTQSQRIEVAALEGDAYPDSSVYVDIQVVTLMAVPLRVRDTVVGVLELANKCDGPFTEEDQFLAETLASSAAIAIDNAQLVEELRRQTLDLQVQNEDLDAFSHTVAHDLKNPIGIIIGFAHLLEQECEDMLDERQADYLERIILGGRKMGNIIDELLLLAEIRKADTERVPLNMGNIVSDARKRLSNHLLENKATLTLPDSWPVVLGYAPWIEEVWVNYLSNALKYGSQPPEIELGATRLDDGMVRLWIRNRGLELSEQQRGSLFAPFTRLNQVQAQGNGLGLSIVRRIAEKLGGTVGVDNEPGYGPVFWFTLEGKQNGLAAR